MSAINGSLWAVFHGASFAEAVRLFSCKNSSLKVDVDLPDVTTKDSGGWAANLIGLKNWSIDFEGVYDPATQTAITPDELLALFLAQTVSVRTGFIPKAITTLNGVEGSASFKSFNITGNMESGITFSGSFVGNGPLIGFVTP